MMKKKIITMAAVLLLGFPCIAQNLSDVPKKCTAFKPDALEISPIPQSVTESLTEKSGYGQSSYVGRSKTYWFAYSDRDNNTTYTAPGSNRKYGSLSFNEQVRIAKIEDDYALVYYDPKYGDEWPKISAEVQWKGWVPMAHLLLWDSCPVNEKGIYNKAMICANIDKDIKNGNLGKLFKDPKNTREYTSLSTNFVYYFEMKRVGDMALLAKENTLNGQSYKVLYGWVDVNSFVAWNQRTCLEPTWEIEDVEYFASKGTRAPIYEDAKQTRKAASIGYEKKSSSSYDPYLYRMNGDLLRYPILDKNTSSLWNCSTFSSPGASTINLGSTDKSSNKVTQIAESLRQVKIVIVIDGTKSMEDYYAPVKEAIKQVNNYFQRAQDVKVQVGVVIYRDYADGDKLVEKFPFSKPENPNLAQWLDSGGKGGIRSSSKDKTMDEALFYGINYALDSFQFNKDESNFMFIIGDCGNDAKDTKVSRETIIKKLVDKNVNLIGFQVRNFSTSPSFGAFNNQLQYIMMQSMQQRYKAFPSMKDKKVISRMNSTKDGYTFAPDNSTGATFFYASHRYVQNGEMEASKLKDLMTNAFSYVQQTVTKSEDVVINATTIIDAFEKGSDGGTFTQIDYDFLVNKLGKDYVESLKKQNTTISFKGFTPKMDTGSDRDYYKTVIFISQEEFNTLMIRLKDLYAVAQAKSNDRAPYVKAMKALIQGMIPGISDADMQQMDVNEVMKLIAGVNVQTGTMKKFTLAQVASTAAVKPAAYLSLLNDFKIKYQKLMSIKSNPYKFVRKFNGATYYWIPTEDLP
jgi:hypothetical protein